MLIFINYEPTSFSLNWDRLLKGKAG